MSIELHAEDSGKVVEVKLTGKLHRDDYTTFVPGVDQLIKERGKLRMLCHLKDFGSRPKGPAR